MEKAKSKWATRLIALVPMMSFAMSFFLFSGRFFTHALRVINDVDKGT